MRPAVQAALLALALLFELNLRAQEVELSWSVGTASRQRLQELILEDVDAQGIIQVFEFPLRINPGVELSPRVTLNAHQFFSHEILFTIPRGENLRIGTRELGEIQNLRIREVGYNLLFNFRRKNSWIRPYLAFGPTLSSFRFSNLKVKKRSGIFRFGFRDVGAVQSAFDSAGVAPLEGGTVFRLGLSYGAGIKFRLTPGTILRVDYRGSHLSDADFFNRQSQANLQQGITTEQSTGRHRRDVFSIGIGFAF